MKNSFDDAPLQDDFHTQDQNQDYNKIGQSNEDLQQAPTAEPFDFNSLEYKNMFKESSGNQVFMEAKKQLFINVIVNVFLPKDVDNFIL